MDVTSFGEAEAPGLRETAGRIVAALAGFVHEGTQTVHAMDLRAARDVVRALLDDLGGTNVGPVLVDNSALVEITCSRDSLPRPSPGRSSAALSAGVREPRRDARVSGSAR